MVVFALLFSSASFAFVSYDEWDGSESSDWNDPDNWEGGSVPGATQAARINDPTTYTNAPIISTNSTFTPRYLVVRDSGVLTVSANLSVTRGIYAASEGQLILNSGTLGNSGTYDLNIRNEDTKVIVNGGTLNIGDDVYLDRLLDLVPGADPTLEINGGRVNVGGDFRFDGIFAEKPTLMMTGGTLEVGGDLYNDGADVTINFDGDSLLVAGDFILDGTGDSLLMTDGVIFLNGNNGTFTNDGIIDASAGDIIFNENYSLGGTGSTQLPNVTISAGTGEIDQGSDIMIAGNWTRNGTYTSNSNEVEFNGTSAQAINGATDFGDLEINNSGAGVTLNADVNIDNTLILTQGVLISDSTNTLNIEDGSTVSGGSASSYVDGYMTKTGDETFIFPLGDQGLYMRLEINDFSATVATDVFAAEYVRGTHPQAFWDSLSYGGDPGGLYNTSVLDYWKLYRTNGTTDVKVKLYWESGDSAQIDNLGDLVVAHYTGSNTWSDEGGVTTGTTASGTVETSNRITSFSPFTFGSSSASANPLPITLLKFEANAMDDVVQVTWSTIEEINNDFFTVERSYDGVLFHEVGKIEGNGNHSGRLDYSFVDVDPILDQYSYYRLKQTDFDGVYTYSGIDAVLITTEAEEEKILLFPNPVSGGFIFIDLPEVSENPWIVQIFDQLGNLVSESRITSDDQGLFNIDAPEIAGMYIIKVIGEERAFTSRFIVK